MARVAVSISILVEIPCRTTTLVNLTVAIVVDSVTKLRRPRVTAGITISAVHIVRHRVVIVIAVAGVALAVPIAVRLVQIRRVRAVVARIADAVGVGICLFGVEDAGAIVAGIAVAIAVGIGLTGVGVVRAVVTGIGHGVRIDIGLGGIGHAGAVVVAIGGAAADARTGEAGLVDAVAVKIGIAQIADGVVVEILLSVNWLLQAGLMASTGQANVTQFINALRAGNGNAFPLLMDCIYLELQALTRTQLAHERPGHVL